MALQGTIDTFPLTDVLTLLEASAKSGLLTLTGARGSGGLWLDGENILGGTLDDESSLKGDRLLFELLRFEDGSFEFSAVEATEFPKFDNAPMSISHCVDSAGKMLEEWQRIESIVPSVRHRISLAPELPVPEVSVDAELWSYLVAISNAETVGEAAKSLRVDIYEGSAITASLVEQRLVVISEPAPESTAAVADDALSAKAPAERTRPAPKAAAEPKAKWDPDESTESDAVDDDTTLIEDLKQEEAMWEEPANNFPERFPIDDLLLDDAEGQDDPWGSTIGGHPGGSRNDDIAHESVGFTGLPDIEPVPLGESHGGAHGGSHANGSGLRDWDEMVNMEPLVGSATADAGNSVEDTADEVLRQMSKLSPKAAEAIAAALGSPGDDTQNPSSGDDITGLGPVSFLDSF